jgi:hypothetical protein
LALIDYVLDQRSVLLVLEVLMSVENLWLSLNICEDILTKSEYLWKLCDQIWIYVEISWLNQNVHEAHMKKSVYFGCKNRKKVI